MLELAAENKLKLAKNFTGKGDLITQAIVGASGKRGKAWIKIKTRWDSN